jgi:hypothetical protein
MRLPRPPANISTLQMSLILKRVPHFDRKFAELGT